MKKLAAIASVSLLAVALLSTVYICIFVQRGRIGGSDEMRLFAPGFDFSLRMNEAACIWDGVDPYDVWSGNVEKPPYLKEGAHPDENHYERINAYTPWEYPIVLPLLALPRHLAWGVFYLSMLVCVGALFAYVLHRESHRKDVWWGMFAAAFPLLVVIHPVFVNLCVGNWTLHIMLAVIGMAFFLNRDRDICAGFCLAFAMIKPQLALLLIIPLLMRRKWRSCAVAAIVCVVAAVVSGWLCGKSPIDLILQVPRAGSTEFYGCGVLPYPFFRILPIGVATVLCLAVGGAICVWLTWCVRRQADWLDFLMPSMVCAICWTYARQYSHVCAWFLLLTFVMALLRRPRSFFLWAVLLLLLLSASRIYRCLYGVVATYGISGFGWFQHSEELSRTIDSFNSLATLILLIVFCVWMSVCDNRSGKGRIGS